MSCGWGIGKTLICVWRRLFSCLLYRLDIFFPLSMVWCLLGKVSLPGGSLYFISPISASISSASCFSYRGLSICACYTEQAGLLSFILSLPSSPLSPLLLTQLSPPLFSYIFLPLTHLPRRARSFFCYTSL